MTQKKNFQKELIKRKWFIKKELKKKISKSIIHNLKTPPKIRSALIFKQQKLKLFASIAKQNKICLWSTKYRGINTTFFLSRHFIKKFANWNDLQNVKVKSW